MWAIQCNVQSSFQFLMVRLKAEAVRDRAARHRFQFLMVRLKENGFVRITVNLMFQFLMVRLKAFFN